MAKTIGDYKKDYAAARERGDAAGMQAANDGANAIRASLGLASQSASSDIAKVAAGGSGGTSGSNAGRGGSTATSSGGSASRGSSSGSSSSRGSSSGGSYYGGGSSGGSSGGSTGGAYTSKYSGGNAALDSKLSSYSQQYSAARERAMAGDVSAVREMQEANDRANQLRNQYGYAAELATDDIAAARRQAEALSGSSGGGYGATGSGMQSQGQQTPVTDSPEYKSLLGELDSLRGQLQQSQSDYSDYVRQLQEAAKAKSLSELEAAYKKNVNAIDAARGQIAPQYTDARNQVAGQAAVSRKNWQETASALGVNSGAAGQSDIAQNLAMQNNLAALDKAETADMAALDLQKTQAATDYNSAIAKAEADGDYALAASLYQEKVRADEAARADQATKFQQMLQQIQLEHGMGQDALAQQNWEQNREDTLTQQGWNNRFQEEQAADSQQNQEFNKLLTLVSSFAESTGDYSLFNKFGFTPDQVAAWNSAWAQKHALELQQAYAKLAGGSKTSGSGTNGGSGAGTAGTQTVDWSGVENWVKLYGEDAAENYIKANYKNLGYPNQSMALAAWSNHSLEQGRGYNALISDLAQLRAGGATPAEINSVLVNAVNQGIISTAQKMQLQGAYVGTGR